MEVLISLLLIVISGFIIWRSTDGFELASDFLGRKLTKGIKGATINAVASSMPEFLSTMFFLFYLKDANGFSGGIGITGGSAVFNVLIIPISIFFAARIYRNEPKILIKRSTFFRDGVILFVMTGFVAWAVSFPVLRWWHGLLLAGPYLLYVAYLFSSHKKTTGKGTDFQYQPKGRRLVAKDLFLINLEKIVLRGRRIRVTNAWWLLMASVLVMIIGTWLLVYSTDRLGQELDVPLVFVSVILSAAASSIPDTMISIRDAKKGNYEDAFSNALGSNIFDISFALGFPLLLYTLLNGPISMDSSITKASSEIWDSLLVITGIVVLLLSTGKYFNKIKALGLVVLYLIFIGVILHGVLNLDF